ncbi:MAG: peptidylprolyl isomerase, partial [Candidatus Omnitrophica bacterium]|nr:peptidylprolyl isomerase [Candidatus Omnitrophota bacterium]
MLKKMRNKKVVKKIWIVIAIFILPSFLFWGVTTVFQGPKEQDYAGKISGKYVTTSDFRDALKETRNQFIIRFGDEKFYEIQQTIDLPSQAWKRLLLISEAKKRNIKVSDKEVVELIQSYGFFRNSKGEFDNKRYIQIVESLFLVKPRQFEEQVRNNIMIYKLSEEETKAVTVTDEQVKEEYKKINEALSIYYIAAIADNFAKDISISDSVLEDYFKKNTNRFKQPLSFNAAYIVLPTEGKDREWLEKSLTKINTAITKKTDFKELAKELGVEMKETGLFKEGDPIPGIGWSPQVFNILSASKAGDYITPLVMDTTYYVFRIIEKKEPYIPEFAEIKTAVREK